MTKFAKKIILLRGNYFRKGSKSLQIVNWNKFLMKKEKKLNEFVECVAILKVQKEHKE